MQRLEFVEAFAERFPFVHVGQRLVERALRAAKRTGRDIDAAAVEPGHRNLEADAFVAEPVGNRHPRILENHRAGRLRIPAHLALVGADRKPGRIAFNDNGRDAAGSVAAGPHHRHIEVALAGTRNELLLAVEHVVIAVAHRAGAQRRGVRSGAGFGQAIAREQFHGAELRQPLLALGVVAVSVDHPGRHVVDRDERRHGRAALRQRLEDQRCVEPRQGRAADVVADIDAANAERRGLAHHLDREMLLLVPADRMRRDFLRRKSRAMSRTAIWSSLRAKWCEVISGATASIAKDRIR